MIDINWCRHLHSNFLSDQRRIIQNVNQIDGVVIVTSGQTQISWLIFVKNLHLLITSAKIHIHKFMAQTVYVSLRRTRFACTHTCLTSNADINLSTRGKLCFLNIEAPELEKKDSSNSTTTYVLSY